MQKLRICFSWVLMAFAAEFVSAQTTIQTVDNEGAPVRNVLVIVSAFDGKGELGRYLTDDQGAVPPIRLENKLYRIIATCPYGWCKTVVREVSGSTIGQRFQLELLGLTTHTTSIQVTDESGSPVPGVLVIIQMEPEESDVGRYLTGQDGRVPRVRFGSNRYRIIATCPYGLCSTAIREVSGSSAPDQIQLAVPIKPIDIAGEWVAEPGGSSFVEMDSKESAGVQLLIRDKEAERERWYTPGVNGKTKVVLPGYPAVLVFVRGSCSATFSVSRDCSREARSTGVDGCLTEDHRTIRIPAGVCR